MDLDLPILPDPAAAYIEYIKIHGYKESELFKVVLTQQTPERETE